MGKWAEVIMLGDVRFGMLVDGPFDGRCYPLPEGTPPLLDVPTASGTARYELRDGRYRYLGAAAQARPAA